MKKKETLVFEALTEKEKEIKTLMNRLNMQFEFYCGDGSNKYPSAEDMLKTEKFKYDVEYDYSVIFNHLNVKLCFEHFNNQPHNKEQGLKITQSFFKDFINEYESHHFKIFKAKSGKYKGKDVIVRTHFQNNRIELSLQRFVTDLCKELFYGDNKKIDSSEFLSMCARSIKKGMYDR